MCSSDLNYKISENYKFTITDSYEEQKNIGISRCITEVLVNDSSGIWTKQTAEEYCDCAIQKLFSKGYTYKEILDIEDENSTTFNEIAVPCVSEVFSKKSKTLAKSKKISEDIEGGTEKCIIPLTDYFGKGYKIKLSLSGIIKYFLLDTGASDIIIDRETERELLIKGILKEDNYLEKTHYS